MHEVLAKWVLKAKALFEDFLCQVRLILTSEYPCREPYKQLPEPSLRLKPSLLAPKDVISIAQPNPALVANPNDPGRFPPIAPVGEVQRIQGSRLM
jgi:hypothetical protein